MQRNFELKLKIPFCKDITYGHSVILYGTETWTLKVDTMNRIEASEIWILRRLQKISWTEHIPNDEMLRRSKTGSWSQMTLIVKKHT